MEIIAQGAEAILSLFEIDGKKYIKKQRIQKTYRIQELDEKLRKSRTKKKKNCKVIGKNIALLHQQEIIHGDLTTSNMILKGEEVYFIDFGLSFIDPKAEHKAVDLHLLRQALESKHYKHYESSFRAV